MEDKLGKRTTPVPGYVCCSICASSGGNGCSDLSYSVFCSDSF